MNKNLLIKYVMFFILSVTTVYLIYNSAKYTYIEMVIPALFGYAFYYFYNGRYKNEMQTQQDT